MTVPADVPPAHSEVVDVVDRSTRAVEATQSWDGAVAAAETGTTNRAPAEPDV